MSKPLGTISTPLPTPNEICQWFYMAHRSHADGVRWLLACGQALKDIKVAQGLGNWALWVKKHEHELGFGLTTADRLIRAHTVHSSSTTSLTNGEAVLISRAIWGNLPPVNQLDDRRSSACKFLSKVHEWMVEHPAPDTARELPHDEAAALRDQLEQVQRWLALLCVALERPAHSKVSVRANA